jgi:hypothetical protein
MAGEDFLKLLISSKGITGNSSVGIRECSYQDVLAIHIGTRQNRRERGSNVIDVDYNQKDLQQALDKILEDGNRD